MSKRLMVRLAPLDPSQGYQARLRLPFAPHRYSTFTAGHPIAFMLASTNHIGKAPRLIFMATDSSVLSNQTKLQRGGGRSGRATIPSGDGSQVAGAVPSGVVC
jgi:hypothetical protein